MVDEKINISILCVKFCGNWFIIMIRLEIRGLVTCS